MQDTKSLDGKITLLSYLARQLSTGPAPAALLAEEVPHVVGPALKVSVQVTHSISLHHCSSIDSGHAWYASVGALRHPSHAHIPRHPAVDDMLCVSAHVL